MRNTFYLPTTHSDFSIWLNNFAIKFEVHAAVLGYSTDDVNSVKRDALAFDKTHNAVSNFTAHKLSLVKWRNMLLNAKVARELKPQLQEQLFDATETFLIGIKPRIRKLVQHIKANTKYTSAMGKDLGIIGGQKQIDIKEISPTLKLVFKGGVVVVKWKKGIADAVKIEVNRTGDKWEFLGVDMEPNFIDSTPIAHPAIWQYRAMYLINDELVGQWSDVPSITVG